MTAVLTTLRDRIEEFNTHQDLAASIESKVMRAEDVSIGSTQLSIRHLRTMKSGLIVHLYNIVESVMSRLKRVVSEAFGTVPPRRWSTKARCEWLREHGVARMEGGPDVRLGKMQALSLVFLSDEPLGNPQHIRKPLGSWSDLIICDFAFRLGVDIPLGIDLRRKLAELTVQDQTPMGFLAKRRDALSHGQTTFEEGAKSLLLKDIRAIADVTFEFMELVVNSFQNYVDQKLYVATA